MSRTNSINTIRLIDRFIIGGFVFVLSPLKYLFSFQWEAIISRPRKILVIRLWALGSSLLTFPMIRRLRDHYGEEEVEYHLLATTRNIGIFKNQGYFSQTWNLFDLRDVLRLVLALKSYDIVIDAEEYFRISALASLWLGKISSGYGNLVGRRLGYCFACEYQERRHNLLNCLSLLVPFGIDTSDPASMEPLEYTSDDNRKVEEFLSDYHEKIRIVLHAWWAETAPERFWSPDHWVSLIELLVEKYHADIRIFLTGTAFEQASIDVILREISAGARAQATSICGKFHPFELASFLGHMDAVVSNDTGPMHLAAAMGTPTIGLFGPNIPEAFGPYPPSRNIGLYHGDGTLYIRVHLGEFRPGAEGIIDRISPEEVLVSVEKTLSEVNK